MVPSQGSAPDIESVRAVILLIAVVAAIFWKELLRFLLVLLVIVVFVGMFMFLQSMHG
jgi:hypothetical protein